MLHFKLDLAGKSNDVYDTIYEISCRTATRVYLIIREYPVYVYFYIANSMNVSELTPSILRF
jgi:hypothetical protein